MGAWGWAVLAVLVAALAGAGWWMDRYPGGWRFAFHQQYAADRSRLEARRGTLRRLEREAARSLAALRADLAAERAAHRSRIARAELRLQHLRDPGRGPLLATLGPVDLYQCRLVLSAGGGTAEYPLEEIAVRSEHTEGTGHLHLVLPDGRQQVVDLPGEETDRAALTEFTTRTHDAIAEAKRAKPRRLAEIPEAEAELAEATADTAGRERAEERLEQAEADQAADPRIPGARRALDAERDRWHKLTGSRPR
ncbi:hypothetical protein [Kitasatospora cineracea]|uniref:Uncharacterized protein n=1 Tax=Kitasatospora cineracea TaxID=88074 RepID=A0A8G1UA81_9ACTN|nr:hypothetical protein [Kitasatospora cineracea]ROR35721.1 hypothetical protein EDD39_7383 [Kitasatospora cineracea]